jgi:hypothetical protein
MKRQKRLGRGDKAFRKGEEQKSSSYLVEVVKAVVLSQTTCYMHLELHQCKNNTLVITFT